MTTYDKFCKFCKDMGKPENVYKAHFPRQTRDKNSPVTCPELLKKTCVYCNEIGHTVGFCERKKKDDKLQERSFNKKPARTNIVNKENKPLTIYKNAFADLQDSETEDDDSDIDEIHPNVTVREKKNINYPSKARRLSWFEMADSSDSEGDEE